MKAHTSAFKNKVKEFGREIDSIITYDIGGVTTELGGEELNSVTPHYEGAILKSVMKQLDIDSNVEIPVGTELNYQFGVKVRNDEVLDYSDNYDYVDYGNYIVKEVEKQEDTNSYKITCYDKMLYSMVEYETPKVNNTPITYPITVRDYINAICNHLGLTFASYSDNFANYNKEINVELYLDAEGNSLDYTFRDVLDELAQVTASTICINEDDELEVRYINNTGDTIDEEYLKDVNVNFGEMTKPINTIVLSRAGGSDKISISYPEDLPDDEKNAIVIADNQIMNFNDRDTYMSDILNKLNGLTYSLNDFSSTGICYYDLCDRYNVQIGEETYSCIMFNDEVNITQGLEELIYTDLPEETETDYTKTDKTDRRINQTYIIVDKQNQRIDSVVSNVTEQNVKISQITQTVDEINSKISDIADITISDSTMTASFTLDNINASEPVQIKVRPVSDNISYLYPNTTLFPSSTTYLKNRIVRFHNNTLNTDVDYVLPDDLLIYDANTYDEFYLDYDSHTCQITKRCEYNADGSVSALATEQVVSYPYPEILLEDGDYTLSLIGYEYGYLFVRLMAKNIYTSQFYTKAETDSRINQKAGEIELGVSQTLTNYSTTAQMNSAINVKANEINSVVSTKVGNDEVISKINQTSESITINASKVNLQGYVTATDLSGTGTTTINGSNITTGEIKSSNYQSGTAGTKISLTDGTIDTKSFKVASDGKITSTSGTIGGWNISNSGLAKSTSNYSFEIRTDRSSNEEALLVYDSSNQRYNWYVRPDGYMYARNCEINGTINASSGSFSGSLYSSYGQIGGWALSSDRLYGSWSGSQYSIRPYGVSNDSAGTSQSWGRIIQVASDKNLKHDIKNIDKKFDSFYDNLKPVSFYYNEGVLDDKKHFGFIAQDIIKNQEDIGEDLSMVEKPDKYYNLYKDEIIALNTWQIQKLKEETRQLKKEIEELKKVIKDGNM